MARHCNRCYEKYIYSSHEKENTSSKVIIKLHEIPNVTVRFCYVSKCIYIYRHILKSNCERTEIEEAKITFC